MIIRRGLCTAAKTMNKHLVFVYGTLKRGEPNHYWLNMKSNGYSKFISKAQTDSRFPLIIASRHNIPFLLDEPGSGEVKSINSITSVDILMGDVNERPGKKMSLQVRFLEYKDQGYQYVLGEVYEVDDAMLNALDDLEDHPTIYVREKDRVALLKDGEPDEVVDCWIYFLRRFKEKYLSREFYKEYSSRGPHGKRYVEREARDPSCPTGSDVFDD